MLQRKRTMAHSDNAFSLSSLLCEEDEACFNEAGNQNAYLNHNPSFVLENEDDYAQILVQRETGFGSKSPVFCDDCPLTIQSWLKCARLDAIEWIFSTRAVFGFQYHTAYLSITYFDRFLSKRSIDDGKLWGIRLLSVACVSLAAKMEEYEVPTLSEFPTEDYEFESNVIQRMELLVLSTLEWKMGSITPFSYLHYFIDKFSEQSRVEDLVPRSVELVMAMTKEINLLIHRPSVIAAAAVLVASDGQLTKKSMELKLNGITLWESLENEHIFSCCNLMQQLEREKSRTPKLVVSPNLSSTEQFSSIDFVENFSLKYGATTKRRLTFTDSDQNCPAKKICRPPSEEFDII